MIKNFFKFPNLLAKKIFTGFSNKVKGNLIEVKNEYTTNK